MATLLEAVSFASMKVNPPSELKPKQEVTADLLQEKILASDEWKKEWMFSKRFLLTDLPLARVGNPIRPDHTKMLQAIRCSDEHAPVIVDVNAREVGRTHGFYPKVIVVHGAEIYAAAQQQGRTTIKAWIGIRAAKELKLSISADHDIGVEELRNKLAAKLAGNKNGLQSPVSSTDVWIRDVFPFENYLIFTRKGQDYKQQYAIDDVKQGRNVTLVGNPVAVKEQYVQAAWAKHGHTLPAPHKVGHSHSTQNKSMGLGHRIPNPSIHADEKIPGTINTKKKKKKASAVKADSMMSMPNTMPSSNGVMNSMPRIGAGASRMSLFASAIVSQAITAGGPGSGRKQ